MSETLNEAPKSPAPSPAEAHLACLDRARRTLAQAGWHLETADYPGKVASAIPRLS